MNEVISIEDMLNRWGEWQIIDVRSPGEFSSGHIPGAVNIPLFTDDERATVGTLYKQKSPEAAFREGLKIAGSKMVELVDAAKSNRNKSGKKILIHCWRGGKRSAAMEWLFSFSGMDTYRLEGGYKSYRGYQYSFFQESDFTLKILGGGTGAGKTEILEVLAQQGEQVIDLEKIAHHKGSAFGSIGEPEQPSTEQFENNLYMAFKDIDPHKPVWLENESKSIGRVYIPDGLWHKMRASILYNIDVDKEIRIQRVLRYYCEPVNIELLQASFDKIKERLGGLDYKRAIEALKDRDLKTAADVALIYYDKAYTFQLNNWPGEKVVYFQDCHDVKETASRLLQIK